MASHLIKRHLFDFVETKQDNIAHGALACQNTLFIQRVALIANAHGIAVYILKDKVPESLSGLGIEVQNHCYDYVGAAHEKGLTVSLGQIFPSDSLEEDFDPVEIGAQSWQPKLNVLTERFDALELVNALDQELVDEFVTQLTTGGDAFALIDAKVLVETQRAVAAEASLTGALAAEVTAREADVNAESAALQILITAVQTDVNQNETDADAAITAEATRAQGVEATNAAAVVSEAAARDVAITAAVDGLVKEDVGLGLVENSALSSFAGSTNVVQVGTVASGVWQGTAIADAYIASDVINGHKFTTDMRDRVLANESVLGTRTATQLSQVDATSSIQAQIDAKAADAVVVKKTGVQSIVQNGTSAVLTLTNSTADQHILNCVGADGELRLSGGNVLECTRPGAMYVRASHASGNINIQAQGSSKLVCDDKVRFKVESFCENDINVQDAKKLKFAESSANGTAVVSFKAPDALGGDVDFILPLADGSSGQSIVTDGNGQLSFASGGVALGDANVWTGEQTFNLAIRKQFVVAEDVVHNATTNATKRTLTAAEFGKLNIWNPTSVPTGDQRWVLPTGMPVGSVIWIAWANSHNTNKVDIYPPANELLYKQGTSGNLTYAGIEENEQEHFLKVRSDRWITG